MAGGRFSRRCYTASPTVSGNGPATPTATSACATGHGRGGPPSSLKGNCSPTGYTAHGRPTGPASDTSLSRRKTTCYKTGGLGAGAGRASETTYGHASRTSDTATDATSKASATRRVAGNGFYFFFKLLSRTVLW